MPDALVTALATPGLGWMLFTIAAAGVVRGFTGFGTALIFVPVATQFLPVQEVILIIACTGFFSTAALVPRAWPLADKAEVGAMAAAATLTIPLGLWLLSLLDLVTVRWFVTAVAGSTLLAVITGWRWHGQLGWAGRAGIGGGAGIVGGMTGLTGPMVIIFYLANARSADAVRANTILFLAALDLVLLVNLAVQGQVTAVTVWLAVLLSAPYFCTVLVGQRLFDPKHEKAYRWAAYGVVALAVLSGLPILD